MGYGERYEVNFIVAVLLTDVLSSPDAWVNSNSYFMDDAQAEGFVNVYFGGVGQSMLTLFQVHPWTVRCGSKHSEVF